MVLAMQLLLDVGLLTYLSASVIPLIVGFITKRFADGRLKLTLNALLSALAGGITTAIDTGGTVDAQKWITGIIVAFVVSMLSYHVVLKPTGISRAVQNIAPDFGLGQQKVPASIPADVIAEATVPELAQIAEQHAELTRHYDRASLEALKRDELYDMAKTADIAGRSKMSKDELVGALLGDE